MDFSEEINEAYSIKKAPGEIFQINSGYKKKLTEIECICRSQ